MCSESIVTSDWQRERKSLQDGLAERAVSFEMLEETYQRAMELARENGWSEAEAPLIIFANGLAYLTAQEEVGRLDRSDLPDKVLEELNKTVRQLMQESSRYASMKFKAYRMSQDNEALEMRESALRAENAMLHSRIETFREDEERLKARIRELAAELDALRGEHEAASPNGADARRRAAPVLSGAAWRVERPPLPGEDDKGPHTWAENLFPKVPYRFQRYVRELFFDDERILYFLHRPPFRHGKGIGARLRPREREALLLITDRMVLFLEDAVPTDATMVHWGYQATTTAIERVSDVHVVKEERVAALRLRINHGRKRDEMRMAFPPSHAEALDQAAALIRGFCKSRRSLPRRIYERAPAWEPPDIRAQRLRLEGSLPGAVAERHKEDLRAGCDEGTVRLLTGKLFLTDAGGEEQVVDVTAVTTVELVRSLLGSRFTVRWLEDRTLREWSCRFEYPRSGDFLRILSRLRHLMGQPESVLNCRASGRSEDARTD